MVKKGTPLLIPTRSQVESDMEDLLAARFCPPEWAFLPQVSNGTGATHRRTADGLAMNCYPSRGLKLHGFEIKVSRSDWLREMRDPDKSVAVQKFCDHWWIVVSAKEIVEPGELPSAWGLMVPGRGGLKVITAAPELESEALSRTFIASILRKAATSLAPQSKIDASYVRGKRNAESIAAKMIEGRTSRAEQDRDTLKNSIREFEEASGVRITPWDGGRIGAAVRAVLQHGADPLATMRHQRQIFGGLVDQIDKALAEMDENRGESDAG